MLEINFHPEIEQELSEAYQWYELQSPGLGEDFIYELETAYSLIQTMPNTWPTISKGFRRYLLKRFPYGVIYKIKVDCIWVVAIMHLSRKPDYWLKRII
jgi:hypothetical protein